MRLRPAAPSIKLAHSRGLGASSPRECVMASFAKLLGHGLARTTRGVTRLFGRRTGGRAAAHASALLAPMIETKTARGVLRFRCGSAMAVRHAVDFEKHEPDTRRWIEETIRPGDHL